RVSGHRLRPGPASADDAAEGRDSQEALGVHMRDDRLTALPPESACNFVSSSSQIRPLSRKLFGNCAKTSIQVSVAFRQASNKGCRIGVDPAPVDTCPEAICSGPYTLIVDPSFGVI